MLIKLGKWTEIEEFSDVIIFFKKNHLFENIQESLEIEFYQEEEKEKRE